MRHSRLPDCVWIQWDVLLQFVILYDASSGNYQRTQAIEEIPNLYPRREHSHIYFITVNTSKLGRI